LIRSKTAEEKTIKKAEQIAREKEELLRAKDQFILSLQHHLRTPFTPLREYLERILEGTYGRIENPIVKEKLLEMKKLSDTLGSLMEDLLDIQQIKMGKEILILEDCQIESIIDAIVEEIKSEAEKKGLYLNFLKTPLPKMRLDKRRIREALFNLLDNAIKYTKRGGVTIKAFQVNKKCQIIISDTGIGMSKEEIERFLEGKIFERGEMAKRLYGPGRGIGLTIAVEFIKAHGGKIWAESEGWGKGTAFYIELPLKS
jgi:signal transduction histidine kinase